MKYVKVIIGCDDDAPGADDFVAVPSLLPKAGNTKYTFREYLCGCKANGPGDIPNYCEKHHKC